MRTTATVGVGWIVVLVLGACGGTSSGSGGTGGAGGEGTGGAGGSDPGLLPPADVVFGPAIEWAVPERAYGLARPVVSADGLFDMDGDGRPDLVVLGEDGFVFGAPADPHIRVHWNTGESFALAPSSWALPQEIQRLGIAASDGAGCTRDRAWQLRDMDGDGLVDLLVTGEVGGEGTQESPCREVPLGTPDDPHWVVHFNDGSGFAPAPARLPLPEAMVDALSWHPWRSGRTLRDLDGDGRPDYVVTQDFETAVVPGYGSAPHWKVFRNLGDAFDVATEWPVPPGGENGCGFRAPEGYSADIPTPCSNHRNPVGNESWILRDVTGDARPDLLVIAEWTDLGPAIPGAPDALHWRLHRNTGAGFGSAEQLPLPALDQLEGLREIGNVIGARTDLRYLDAGDFPALVQAGGWPSGPRAWTVHRLGPGGFSAGERWEMPQASNDMAFSSPEGLGLYGCAVHASDCEQRAARWMTVDMDGDGRADLVEWIESESSPLPGSPGARHFRVYLQAAP